ncbi:hypothetical protein D5085_00210 [Ectothiorhodospiraceae bacterium BW-2]|nr:hypothetical protein D5085_00210 [Ectothiorhodospiraceae bacterium BW-2]
MLSLFGVLELATVILWLILNSERLQADPFVLTGIDIGFIVFGVAMFVGTALAAVRLANLQKQLLSEHDGAWPAGMVRDRFTLATLRQYLAHTPPRQNSALSRILFDALLPPLQRRFLVAISVAVLLTSGLTLYMMLRLVDEVVPMDESVPDFTLLWGALGGITLLVPVTLAVIFFWKRHQANQLMAYGQVVEGQLASIRRGGKGAVWAKVTYPYRGEVHTAPLLLPLHSGLYPALLCREQRQQAIWILAAPMQMRATYLIDPHIEESETIVSE